MEKFKLRSMCVGFFVFCFLGVFVGFFCCLFVFNMGLVRFFANNSS